MNQKDTNSSGTEPVPPVTTKPSQPNPESTPNIPAPASPLSNQNKEAAVRERATLRLFTLIPPPVIPQDANETTPAGGPSPSSSPVPVTSDEPTPATGNDSSITQGQQAADQPHDERR